MQINPDSRHAQVFYWALDMWAEFCEKDRWELLRSNGGTNLCQYIRTITVWMPLVILAQLIFVASPFVVLIGLPIYLFGVTGYFGTLSVCIVIVLLVIRLFVGWDMLKRSASRINKTLETRRNRRSEEGEDPSFGQLVIEMVKASKQRVCPLVDFSASAEASSEVN